MIAVVVSRADSASEHIGEQLRAVADWERHSDGNRPDGEGGGTYYRREGFELRTFDDLHLHLERPAAAFETDPNLLVFVSRHAGETGPLLTAHFTGNFGGADYGGDPGAFARACPNAHARVVEQLTECAPDGYEVGIECTHHGPTDVGAPSMFVEIGSGPEQWDDPAAAGAAARAVLNIEGVAPDRPADGGNGGAPNRQVVGFGGGHYAPRFERIVRETPWAVGHVGADWALEGMGDPREHRDRIDRAFRESAAEYAVVEGDRPRLEATVEDLGYRAVSETWVREVGTASLALVGALEDALVPVDDGLRFGDPLPGTDPGDDPGEAFETVDLPDGLLERAASIDAGATREAVAARTLAFGTVEGGSRVAGRAAVAEASDREALVDALASLLAREYDAVTREDGAVVARRTAFDPERARDLGVPEGPAFGDLAAGQPVEVDGREIDPAAVRTERVDRFEV
ncbi:MAG: D-aminoacyl-tRNA deacylase [Halobacteriales archaeon]